jgi:putative ABC transport system substrate-binding protein
LGEPVASGIVPRLNQPGGHITGFAVFETTLAGKWLELLSEIAPGLKRAAIMFNPDFPATSVYMSSFETAARSLKVEQIIAPVHSDARADSDDCGHLFRLKADSDSDRSRTAFR